LLQAKTLTENFSVCKQTRKQSSSSSIIAHSLWLYLYQQMNRHRRTTLYLRRYVASVFHLLPSVAMHPIGRSLFVFRFIWCFHDSSISLEIHALKASLY